MRWVALARAKLGDLDPAVTNGAGQILYRSDKDPAKPPASRCTGSCTALWWPVLISPKGTIYLVDVPKQAVGTVRRDDGTLQVTLGGHPIYRYGEDAGTGTQKGQGVDGTWFAVSPLGKKVTAASGGANESVNLYDDKNFAGAEQGTAGPGCQDIPNPKVASSVKVRAPLKLWSEADCTGESTQITGDVADLATVGFDDKISSVQFGTSGS